MSRAKQKPRPGPIWIAVLLPDEDVDKAHCASMRRTDDLRKRSQRGSRFMVTLTP
jgi:hypothetical protein